MINTSNAWKNLFVPRYSDGELASDSMLLPESNVFMLNDVDLLNSSSIAVGAEFASEYSNLTGYFNKNWSGIVNLSNKQEATFEWNYWLLDGTMSILNENETIDGFASAQISNQNCQFMSTPVVTLSKSGQAFSNVPAITICFAPNINEYASQYSIISGNKNVDVYSTLGEDGSRYEIVMLNNWDNISTIEIDIQLWSMPYRRARIKEFLLGLRFFYDKANMESFKYNKSVDMVNARLPINGCEFSILDIYEEYGENGRFANCFNSSSKFIMYYAFKINGEWEYRKIDTFLLDSLVRPNNGITAQFKLIGYINRLNQRLDPNANGGSGPEWTSISGFIDNLCTLASITISKTDCQFINIQGVGLAESARNSYEDYYEKPVREWLQIIASYSNCVLRADINGNPVFTRYINGYTPATQTTIKSITPVTTIYKELYFKYPEKEDISDIGRFILSASQDSHCTRQFKSVPDSRFDGKGVEQSAENRLIAVNLGSSSGYIPQGSGVETTYMGWLRVFMDSARKITLDCIINPAIQPCDVINVQMKDGTTAKGFVTDIELNGSGCPKGKIEVLVPKQFQ